jgi:hypothetical protein
MEIHIKPNVEKRILTLTRGAPHVTTAARAAAPRSTPARACLLPFINLVGETVKGHLPLTTAKEVLVQRKKKPCPPL